MTCMDIYNSIKNPILDDTVLTAMLDLNAENLPILNVSYYKNLTRFNSEDSEGEDTDHTKHNPEERDKFYVSLFNIFKKSYLKYFDDELRDYLIGIYDSSDEIIRKRIDKSFHCFEELEKSPEFKSNEEIQSYFKEKDAEAILKLFYTDQSDTFHHFHCNSPGVRINNDELKHKFYLNISKENIHKLARMYAEKCDEKGLPFYFKIAVHGGRDEGIVIYSSTENLIDNYNVLREIGKEMPEITKRTTPPVLVAGVLDGWIGYGAEFKSIDKKEQEKGMSYSKARADLLQEAYMNYLMNHLNDCVISPDKTIREYIIEEAVITKCQDEDIEDISSDKKEQIKKGYEELFQFYLKEGFKYKSIDMSFIKPNFSLTMTDLHFILYGMVPEYFSHNDKIKQGIISEIKALSPKYNISPENFCFTLDTKRQFEEYDKKAPSVKAIYQRLEGLAQKYNIKAPRKILISETLSDYESYLKRYSDEKLSTLTKKDKTASPSGQAENTDSGYSLGKDKIVQDDLARNNSASNNDSTNVTVEAPPYVFGTRTSEYRLLKDQIIQDDLARNNSTSNNDSTNVTVEAPPYVFGTGASEYRLLKDQIIQDDLARPKEAVAKNSAPVTQNNPIDDMISEQTENNGDQVSNTPDEAETPATVEDIVSENPIFAILLESINQQQNELQHLNRIREELKAEESSMTRKGYQKEMGDIEKYLAITQERLDISRNTARNYDLAYYLLKDLDRIYNQQDTIRDENDRREMNEEVEAKRKELSASMHALPDELGEELRQRFIAERNKSHTQNNASQSKGKSR